MCPHAGLDYASRSGLGLPKHANRALRVGSHTTITTGSRPLIGRGPVFFIIDHLSRVLPVRSDRIHANLPASSECWMSRRECKLPRVRNLYQRTVSWYKAVSVVSCPPQPESRNPRLSHTARSLATIAAGGSHRDETTVSSSTHSVSRERENPNGSGTRWRHRQGSLHRQIR